MRVFFSLIFFGPLLCIVSCGRSGCFGGRGPADALLAQVEDYQLPNGLRVLLLPRGEAPVFTGVVQVRVGGIEEPPGKAGLAHMFEHMAFKGTPEIGTLNWEEESVLLTEIRQLDVQLTQLPVEAVAQRQALVNARNRRFQEARAVIASNELWSLFHNNGAAELNAFTGKDLTTYYARMPSDAVRLWVYLMSQMVHRPVMREFYAERDVVMEERRTSVDNNPSGQLFEALLRTAYTTSPYREMTIGSMEELQGLTMADAEAFHATYYHPERMVVAVVGHFDVKAAKTSIATFFGAIPPQSTPGARVVPPGGTVREADPPREPVQQAERRVEVTNDASPKVMIAYHKPTLPHRDDYLFDAIQYLLCHGESGRLIKYLERDRQMARHVGCWSSSPGSRLENLFIISAEPLEGHSTAAVVAEIETVLETFRTDLVSRDALRSVQKNLQADFLWELNDNESLAQQLAYFQTVAGDWRYAVTHSQIMATITAEELRDAALRRLQPHQRTIAVLRRP
ncbi:MAG: insulinase family protein [Deltaproteobacteria bacterium]|nr:insulinase family protein [Deltaproteobacteria bacterium]